MHIQKNLDSRLRGNDEMDDGPTLVGMTFLKAVMTKDLNPLIIKHYVSIIAMSLPKKLFSEALFQFHILGLKKEDLPIPEPSSKVEYVEVSI